MRQQHDMHGAAARAARIRRAHDMEATLLDSMHRRAQIERVARPASIYTRMLRRIRSGTGRIERLPEAAPEK